MNKIFVIDLDGTLIQGQSQMYLIQHLRKIGKISLFKYLTIMISFALYRLSVYGDIPKLLKYSLNNFKGETAEDIDRYIEDFFDSVLIKKYFTYTKELVETIQASGEGIVILSAVIEPLAKRISKDLGIEHYICTKLEFDENNVFTGNILADHVYGKNKLSNLKKYLSEHSIKDEDVTILTDHISDISVLKHFKNSIVTNPGTEMTMWARQNNYPIIYLDNNESIQYIKHYIESR